MVISLKEVKNIVKNLGERDLKNPEGMGVDLRIGSVHSLVDGEAFIESDGVSGQGRRSGFNTKEIISFLNESDTQEYIIINPGDYYLVKTIETVDIPIDVMADFRPRSSLFRSGLQLLTTVGAPGYSGELIFGLTNSGSMPVKIQMGARICTAVFYRLESDGIAYRGQNQGGRVTVAGTEQQV